MTDNPYRFTVKVTTFPNHCAWWVDLLAEDDDERDWIGQLSHCTFPTEAEANEHADMILAALQGATRE